MYVSVRKSVRSRMNAKNTWPTRRCLSGQVRCPCLMIAHLSLWPYHKKIGVYFVSERKLGIFSKIKGGENDNYRKTFKYFNAFPPTAVYHLSLRRAWETGDPPQMRWG